MKRMMKRFIVGLLAVITLFSVVGCVEIEQPDWVKQNLCDHVYDEEEIIKEATCGRNGSVMKICSDCGATKLVTIKATGKHVFDTGISTESGIMYTCIICKKIKTESHSHKDADFNGKCDSCGLKFDRYAFDDALETAVSVGEIVAGKTYRLYSGAVLAFGGPWTMSYVDGVFTIGGSVNDIVYEGITVYEYDGYVHVYVSEDAYVTVYLNGGNSTFSTLLAEDELGKSGSLPYDIEGKVFRLSLEGSN